MLRITQNRHPQSAKSYYSTADYFLEGQEIAGRWRGEAARRLGLSGEVKREDWEALCDNLHPRTGEQLTARRKSERTVGYDFNFHVPKSVSLLYAMTRDERLLDAFRNAVDDTMHNIETEMRTRVRKAGKNEDRVTGNMVWGEFIHLTSRPVDGVPDPHLHAHAFVFNSTFDKKEQAWKAGQFRELKRDAPYFEAVFHSRLAHGLTELGLPIERRGKNWELGGLTPEHLQRFSRRTAQIEEKAREWGISDPEAKAELGSKTRERKQKHLTMEDLQTHWRKQMSQDEFSTLSDLAYRIGGDAEPRDDGAAVRAIEHALGHSFERKSVVPERHVLATALRQSLGQATVEQVLDQAARSDMIVGDRGGRRMATTREVLGEEKYVVAFARSGRGTCRPFVNGTHSFSRAWLNADQRKAARHVLESSDRVMVIRGAAGVGKTTLMKEVVEAVEESGTKVFAFAPSAAASRGVLRAEGFEADTVARLLIDEEMQAKARGQLLWIDEAGLVGMKTMSHVFALADKLEARVLLTGDRRQHGSVERGAALQLLEEEAGIRPVEVKEIQRQKGEYKEAVNALSEGRTIEGFDRLDRLGWVQEIPDADRYRQLASDYVAATSTPGKSAIVVSPTHAEAERITREIRGKLRQTKQLGSEERTYQVLQKADLTEAERGDRASYVAGDVLQFHQNAKGFVRGDRLQVGASRKVPVEQAARFQVFRTKELKLATGDVVRITQNGKTADGGHRLDNGSLYRIRKFDREGNIVLTNGWLIGRDFGHLAHGYVVTSYAAQGRTIDQVFIGQSSESFAASSREQFYVSCSRGRHKVTIYTADKESLRDAINRSDDRVTATEFVNAKARQVVALQQRSVVPIQKLKTKEAMYREAYERP